MVLLDVIFPAFSAAYVMPLFFPLAGGAAIVSEVTVFLLLERAAPRLRTALMVVLANCASWVAGIGLTGWVLPSGLVEVPHRGGGTIPRPGPNFETYGVISFFLACALSIIIELPVVLPFRRKLALVRPTMTVSVANVVSYVVLGGIVLVLRAVYAL
jgi:hypothetical protein